MMKQLILGSDGNISHSKLWSNVGNVVATVIILFQTYHQTASDELILIYLAILSGHATASKIITSKLNIKP